MTNTVNKSYVMLFKQAYRGVEEIVMFTQLVAHMPTKILLLIETI